MQRGKVERMLYIVAYDIPNDRRRTKVHKALCGFGRWTQYSLFECYLNDRERVALRAKLDTLLKADEDSVRFYFVCGACAAKVETIGSPKPAEETVYIV
ncbi:MAG TPA: CRISPR-associated endonuclease Cas2 [Anaerolineae bacterium]|nr:CRISPR-associated endonuclease Cas2 [Anaerolineae bacterium]HPL28799.1 CRISPR-associated endonuclease Cas2 [Anaerolineae bacterium]